MRDGVLITRPEPGAAETAQRVAGLGWQAVPAPALVLQRRKPARLPATQAVLLPSRAAARALFAALDSVVGEAATAPPLAAAAGVPEAEGLRPLPEHSARAGRASAPLAPHPGPRRGGPAGPRAGLAALPILAVGEATAAEARALGARNVMAAEGDAAALAALAAARLDPAAGPLLLAVGQGYGGDLAAALRGRGFRVIRRVVYAASPAAALPEQARAALAAGRIGAALFFSPRSAAIACRLMTEAGLGDAARGIAALALSPRIAEALATLPWRMVRVAARPDQSALLGLLGPAPRGTTPARTC